MSYFIKPPRFRSSAFYGVVKGLHLHPRLTVPFLFTTGASPYFDQDSSTSWFLNELQQAKTYVEFGSGGSTYMAAQLGLEFVSKESDIRFCLSVRNTIEQAGLARPNQRIEHADIGITASWGFPAGLWQPNTKRLAQFEAYSDFPEMEVAPDLVLIDGRFRVATFLKAVRALQAAPNCTIVFDDYEDRPYYHVVEQFATKAKAVGRMGIFKPLPITDMAALEQQLGEYRFDPR